MTEAPGELERIRAFLNTWEVPNDTREPVDRLPDLADDPQGWHQALPGVPRPDGAEQVAGAAVLRDRLRDALGQARPAALQPLLEAGWRVQIGRTVDEPAVALVPASSTTATALLSIVLAAVLDGHWQRLRACPDCAWVFYDSSRNGRRTWCSMTAADGARGCGSIAKTRAYRVRQRAPESP